MDSITFKKQYAAKIKVESGAWQIIGPQPVEGDTLIADEWTTEEVAKRRAHYIHTICGVRRTVRVVCQMVSEEIVVNDFQAD